MKLNALLDLGTSIDVMWSIVYKALNLGDLKPTNVIVQLANKSSAQPLKMSCRRLTSWFFQLIFTFWICKKKAPHKVNTNSRKSILSDCENEDRCLQRHNIFRIWGWFNSVQWKNIDYDEAGCTWDDYSCVVWTKINVVLNINPNHLITFHHQKPI